MSAIPRNFIFFVFRWSDGSLSLHLGSEIFDVHKQPLQGDFNHLFIRQGTGLQGQAVFRTKLSFRPHSTESFTHQKMTRSMADRTNKAAGIKVISQVGRDPEANRYKRVKEEEEKLRADMRRDSKVKRMREKVTGRGLTTGYLEGGDSDEEDISIAAIKNKYKKNKKGGKNSSPPPPRKSNCFWVKSLDLSFFKSTKTLRVDVLSFLATN